MFDVLTKFLDSKIDYQTIFAFIGVYLLALWLMFCLWVFVDANKRYKKPFVAVGMALLVFVFNFPALIFYLIVRPEVDEFAELAAYDSMLQGGVQVPIVQFTGANGEVQMSLQLQIHPQPQTSSDMVIDVGWDSNQANMRVGMPATVRETVVQAPAASQSQERIHSRWESLRNKAQGHIKNIQTNVNSTVASKVESANAPEAEAVAEAVVESAAVEAAPETSNQHNNQNRNDKKNRRNHSNES